VASGDPLCAPEHVQAVLARFASFARAQRLSLCFVGATPRCYAAARALGFGALKVGEEPIFDLSSYAPRGDRAKKARAARNHALRLGVTVREYRPLEASGALAEHVCAYARVAGAAAVTVVPRLLARRGVDEPPLEPAYWADTAIPAPAATPLVNVFTGERVEPDRGRLPLGRVLARFPVALLAPEA
ncbi:MAG: phosphatidylglycerol lysyltransferase domain-containing protein, partial [Candidatus Rokubacteria bacterium]|nr:phosphatidylglycerol lysyltransferase domain-containing protein [Candidatus Rokubacteria bacterium]